MNRLGFVLASILVAPAAFAITFGEPDGDDHPSVGAIVLDFDDVPYPPWHGYFEWCTSTLIAPRVVLTAAHCTLDLEEAGYPDGDKDMYVSFEEGPFENNPRRIPSTWHKVSAVITHPDYVQNASGAWLETSDPSDIALLVLEEPVKRITPSTLPEVGFLDAIAPSMGRGTNTGKVLTVGYGGQITSPPPELTYYDTRWQAWMSWRGLQDAWLLTSQNPQLGDGGTCYGDSGGPVFVVDAQGNETLVAITSWGDVPCISMGKYYRTDIQKSADFIDEILAAVAAGEL